MTSLTCPICGAPVDSEQTSAPFCGCRCQHVDLNRWLNEEYGLPHESEGGDEAGIEET